MFCFLINDKNGHKLFGGEYENRKSCLKDMEYYARVTGNDCVAKLINLSEEDKKELKSKKVVNNEKVAEKATKVIAARKKYVRFYNCIPLSVRKEVVKVRNKTGKPYKEIAKGLKISASSACNIYHEYEARKEIGEQLQLFPNLKAKIA